jgi:hypothetical protein
MAIEDCFERLAKEAREAETSRDRQAAIVSLLKYQHKCSEKFEHSGSVSIVVENPFPALPAEPEPEEPVAEADGK